MCSKCGVDSWVRRADNDHWRCRPCHRKWHSDEYRGRDPAFALWRGAKQRAREKGQTFTITVDDVRSAWPKDGRCPALGVKLTQGRGHSGPTSATLDRLNASWGYEPGNIAVISHAANTAKSGLSASELAKIVKWMKKKGLN